MITCQHVVVHDGFALSTVYICDPESPARVPCRLELEATDGSCDLALLYTPEVHFHRLIVDEYCRAYELAYHIEVINMTSPTLRRARILTPQHGSPFFFS